MLHERAFTFLQRFKSLLRRDRGDHIHEIPFALRLARLLRLEKVHIAHHPPIVPNLAVLRHKVIDWHLLHLGDDLFRLVGASRLDRLQVVHGRTIYARLKHGWGLSTMPSGEALSESPRLVVLIPIIGLREEE